jgi:hypothetical protein
LPNDKQTPKFPRKIRIRLNGSPKDLAQIFFGKLDKKFVEKLAGKENWEQWPVVNLIEFCHPEKTAP